MGAVRLIFRFEKSARTPGHFDAQLVLEDPVTGQRCDWSNSQYQPNDALNLGPHIVQNPMTIRIFWFSRQLLFSHALWACPMAVQHQERMDSRSPIGVGDKLSGKDG